MRKVWWGASIAGSLGLFMAVLCVGGLYLPSKAQAQQGPPGGLSGMAPGGSIPAAGAPEKIPGSSMGAGTQQGGPPKIGPPAGGAPGEASGEDIPLPFIPSETQAPSQGAQPARPAGSIFSQDEILKAYQNFMKMTSPRRTKTGNVTPSTEQARSNPIWKFHSWLQAQLMRMEETGEGASGGEGLCFVCHNGEFIVNYNFSGDQKGIKQVFDLTFRHPVRKEDKSTFFDPLFPTDPTKSDPIWARSVQCITCHNPGVVTGKTSEGGYPLTLPTEAEIPFTQRIIDGWPTLDNPPWPYDTMPKPLVYGQPFADDPDPNVQGDETPGMDDTEIPDFTTFCQTCHRQIAGRYGMSNNYSRLKYDPIRFIKGDGGGNVATHGMARGRESHTDTLGLKEPFRSSRLDEEGNVIANLYLSCTDCHEPHGSINPYFIRTKVNGISGVRITKEKFYGLCSKCHHIANPWPGGYPHGLPGDMAERNCIECHNHAAGGGRF